jgi:hypothetical protein
MKKFLIPLLFLAVIACGGNKPKAEVTPPQMTVEDDGLVTYLYKVDGLQDTVISDSIWKMIFTIDGIEKLVISKDDSAVVFTVNPDKVQQTTLQEEITKRGGDLL